MDQNIIVHEVPTGAEPEGVAISRDGKVLDQRRIILEFEGDALAKLLAAAPRKEPKYTLKYS